MSWKKYGSPYDPGHQGKMQKPKSKKEAERREHQLRGCFDPNCNMCNPETAQAGGMPSNDQGNGSRRGRGSVSFSLGNQDAMREVARNFASSIRPMPSFSEFMNVFEDYDSATSSEDAQPQRVPSRSYLQARKEVEKWLSKAPEQAFDDIVGNDEALEQLRDAIQAPVVHKALYEAYGMKMPKGALLSGPPGCGKTMFARAAASEMRRLYGDEVEFISISGSELQSPYVGVTEGYIKSIFTYAREYKAFHGHPLLVFMDEADALLPDRTGRVRRVASWEESQVATFLAEMDGMHESGAFMLLATNRPEVIDQAVLRDGRCDFKIVVKRPTQEAIETILRKNFDGTVVGTGVERESLVFAATECFFDPNKVILFAHAVGVDPEERKIFEAGKKHFLLEHILSGAMAASIPGRAKRYAFARDRANGVVTGVTVDDVVKAVNDVFDENKGLEHSFAMDEFRAEFMAEVMNKRGEWKEAA